MSIMPRPFWRSLAYQLQKLSRDARCCRYAGRLAYRHLLPLPPHSGAYNLPKIEGVRGDRFKLIGYYDHPKLKLGEQWELFELEQDPQELHSQHANPEFAAPRTWLEAELQRLRHDYGVPRLEASSPPLLADKTSCVTFAR